MRDFRGFAFNAGNIDGETKRNAHRKCLPFLLSVDLCSLYYCLEAYADADQRQRFEFHSVIVIDIVIFRSIHLFLRRMKKQKREKIIMTFRVLDGKSFYFDWTQRQSEFV